MVAEQEIKALKEKITELETTIDDLMVEIWQRDKHPHSWEDYYDEEEEENEDES